MNPQENKMETINLTDIFQPQLLAEAEATRVNAEQALHNVKTETTAERAMMVEQYNKLRAEMPALKQKLGPLQECIRVKARIDLDTASDKEELAKAETLVVKMEAEFNELSGKFRPQEERTKELIAEAMIALSKASDAENKVRARIGKAIIAHNAYQANPAIGVGPFPKFKTLKEAVRHFCKIGFSLAGDGSARRAFVGDLISPGVQNGNIEGMIPVSLSWLGHLEPFKDLPCHPYRAHIFEDKLACETLFSSQLGRITDHKYRLNTDRKIVCYIENSGEILASHTARRVTMPGNLGVEDFSDLFGSWEDKLAPFMKELTSASTLDLQTKRDLSMLEELICEAWKTAAAAVSLKQVFLDGQGRLNESKINELVGAYWKAFIQSPWEPSIEGSYALLKHRCARGEIPNVYSYDVQGHFGFRVRTPDHDWIIGEIYCPSGHYAPTEDPDPAKLINLESTEDDWLAELGPVRFRIKKATSRK